MGFELDPSYKDVPARLADLKAKYPDARVRVLDKAHPYRIETIGNQTFISVVVACYRTADDPEPATGMAWEPFPGKTPYTRDSELQNAETSAWGRAIVAALASESKSIASAEDVRNRRADAEAPEPLGEGWATYAERDDAWDDLKAAQALLTDDQREFVKASLKELGFTKHNFSVKHADLWSTALSESLRVDNPSEPDPVVKGRIPLQGEKAS